MSAFLNDKPARVFGVKNVSVFEPGKDADIAIFDIGRKIEIKEADFKSRGVDTPFIDQKVHGETVMTLVDGEAVYQRGTKRSAIQS